MFEIETIAYKNERFELPPAENRKVSNWLYKTISDIQTSKIEDKFGWIVKL